MEVDEGFSTSADDLSERLESLNFEFPSFEVRSMQVISTEDRDLIVCALNDGRVIQVNAERDILNRIAEEP